MATFRLAAGFCAVALSTAAFLGPATAATAGTAGTAGTVLPAKGVLPPKNPSHNVRPRPDFLAARSCAGGRDSAACNALAERAVDRARRLLEKKIGRMSFSLAAYEKLTPAEQLFVTVNLERTERGLPAVAVLTRSLDKIAQEGAKADTDPPLGKVPGRLPGGGHWVSLGGNWAGGYHTPLGADYGWMYQDKGSAWGHRDNILGRYVSASSCGRQHREIAMGAGRVARGRAYGDSETELFAGICGHAPTDRVMTWARARKLLHIK